MSQGSSSRLRRASDLIFDRLMARESLQPKRSGVPEEQMQLYGPSKILFAMGPEPVRAASAVVEQQCGQANHLPQTLPPAPTVLRSSPAWVLTAVTDVRRHDVAPWLCF
jgi:hypothetical protein